MKYFDNTRLSAFKTCPRFFYYRHRRHWRPQGTAIELVFGLSWHAAMDAVWKGLNQGDTDETVLKRSLLSFEEVWKENGLTGFADWTLEDSEKYSPRTPGVAAEMLFNYIKHRRDFIKAVEILHIEMPFAVPLTDHEDGPIAIGRTDKVIRIPHNMLGLSPGIYGIEHKTTSWYKKDGGFRNEWMESFSPNAQVDGYIHQLNMNFKKVRGILVDGALVHKTVHDKFRFISCDRLLEQLDAWLNETLYYIQLIEAQDNLLQGEGKDASYLRAFPKNTESCSGRYGKLCIYRDICRFFPNPETVVEAPEGFIEEKWQPFDVLKLKKIGLPPEE